MSPIILDIHYFSRLPKAKRLDIIKAYPRNGLRINCTSGNLEVILVNWNKKQEWIPANYCLNAEWTTTDWAEIYDVIKNTSK